MRRTTDGNVCYWLPTEACVIHDSYITKNLLVQVLAGGYDLNPVATPFFHQEMIYFGGNGRNSPWTWRMPGFGNTL